MSKWIKAFQLSGLAYTVPVHVNLDNVCFMWPRQDSQTGTWGLLLYVADLEINSSSLAQFFTGATYSTSDEAVEAFEKLVGKSNIHVL